MSRPPPGKNAERPQAVSYTHLLGEDEHAENAYPYHIEGNAGSFGVRNGYLMIPDCLVVNAHSTYTAWELNSGYNTQSGFETLFEYLMDCEVQPYTMLRDGEYASYFYTGIRIYLQSTIDPVSYTHLCSIPEQLETE